MISVFCATVLTVTLAVRPAVGAAPVGDSSGGEPDAATVTIAMGLGFNLGNTFDLDQRPTEPALIRPVIDFYVAAGMKHVRIPITWWEGFGGDVLADPIGNVNFDHPRFGQLQEVIDYALHQGLYVVINAHHEREFKAHYNGTRIYDAAFSNLWTQIARYFSEYPPQLVFELLNEPEGAFGDTHAGSDPFGPQALEFTRQINRVGHRAIRATGGRNATRVIMVAPNRQGNQSMIEEVFPDQASLPGAGSDRYLVIQVHTYDPWSFCGQDGDNSAYPGAAEIKRALRAVAAHGHLLGVPINYGEFGVGRREDQSDRDSAVAREFYRTIGQTVLAEKMSATVWDDGGWFGLLERDATGHWQARHGLVPAMLE